MNQNLTMLPQWRKVTDLKRVKAMEEFARALPAYEEYYKKIFLKPDDIHEFSANFVTENVKKILQDVIDKGLFGTKAVNPKDLLSISTIRDEADLFYNEYYGHIKPVLHFVDDQNTYPDHFGIFFAVTSGRILRKHNCHPEQQQKPNPFRLIKS